MYFLYFWKITARIVQLISLSIHSGFCVPRRYKRKNMTKRIALYPGTFDPMTLGHLDIMKRASNLCDKLVIAVAINRGKNPLFALAERVEMVEHVVAPFRDRIEVEVKPFEGLLIHFVESVGASMIVRGLRAVSDFEYEFQMAGMKISNYCFTSCQRDCPPWR